MGAIYNTAFFKDLNLLKLNQHLHSLVQLLNSVLLLSSVYIITFFVWFFVTGSKGKEASAIDRRLPLNLSPDLRVPDAEPYISTSGRTPTRSPLRLMMSSILSKRVCGQQTARNQAGSVNAV